MNVRLKPCREDASVRGIGWARNKLGATMGNFSRVSDSLLNFCRAMVASMHSKTFCMAFPSPPVIISVIWMTSIIASYCPRVPMRYIGLAKHRNKDLASKLERLCRDAHRIYELQRQWLPVIGRNWIWFRSSTALRKSVKAAFRHTPRSIVRNTVMEDYLIWLLHSYPPSRGPPLAHHQAHHWHAYQMQVFPWRSSDPSCSSHSSFFLLYFSSRFSQILACLLYLKEPTPAIACCSVISSKPPRSHVTTFRTNRLFRGSLFGDIQELDGVVERYEFPKLNLNAKYQTQRNRICGTAKIYKPKIAACRNPNCRIHSWWCN